MASSNTQPRPKPADLTTEPIELSIVVPCLNEEKTVGNCVDRCWAALEKLGIRGEVVVCDNNSSDGSGLIAKAHGARVVVETKLGYGNACIRGLNEGRGEYLLKLDADGSYDPDEIEEFVNYLRQGYDVVMGTRLRGTIMKGAMPWTHRYIGNPALTLAANTLCQTNISDLCCGMKAFRRAAYERLTFTAQGMEFGPETTIRARQVGLSLKEVPITYYPDGRTGASSLRRWRDGVKDLLFILRQSVLFRKFLA